MASTINSSFPQPPLFFPKSLIAVKTPNNDPDTNGNSQAATNKITTTAAEITGTAPRQVSVSG
jgi:hypothetical protein